MSQSLKTSSLHRSFSQVPWAEVIGMLGTLQSISPTRVEFCYHGRYFQIGDNGGEINIHEMVPACNYSIPYEGRLPLESEDLAGMIVAALNGEPPSWHPIPSQSTPGPLDLEADIKTVRANFAPDLKVKFYVGEWRDVNEAFDRIVARLRPPAPPAPDPIVLDLPLESAIIRRLTEINGVSREMAQRCADAIFADWIGQDEAPSPPPSPAVPDALTWTREKPTERVRAIVRYKASHGAELITIADFIPYKTVQSPDFLSEECDPGDCDWYDEENDCYWVNECWFESSYEADTNWVLTDEVIGWIPVSALPEPRDPSQSSTTPTPEI